MDVGRFNPSETPQNRMVPFDGKSTNLVRAVDAHETELKKKRVEESKTQCPQKRDCKYIGNGCEYYHSRKDFQDVIVQMRGQNALTFEKAVAQQVTNLSVAEDSGALVHAYSHQNPGIDYTHLNPTDSTKMRKLFPAKNRKGSDEDISA